MNQYNVQNFLGINATNITGQVAVGQRFYVDVRGLDTITVQTQAAYGADLTNLVVTLYKTIGGLNVAVGTTISGENITAGVDVTEFSTLCIEVTTAGTAGFFNILTYATDPI
jgi:hypothetical protein